MSTYPQDALLSLSIIDAISVQKVDQPHGAAQWIITFHYLSPTASTVAKNAGNLPTLLIDSHHLTGTPGVSINVTTIQNGTDPILGKLRVGYAGNWTRKILHDASSETMLYYLNQDLPLLPKNVKVR